MRCGVLNMRTYHGGGGHGCFPAHLTRQQIHNEGVGLGVFLLDDFVDFHGTRHMLHMFEDENFTLDFLELQVWCREVVVGRWMADVIEGGKG